MYATRSVGRNSFAVTFEAGSTTEEVFEAIRNELTKKVDGVPYYGYTLAEEFVTPPFVHYSLRYQFQDYLTTVKSGKVRRVRLNAYGGGSFSLEVGVNEVVPNLWNMMPNSARWTGSRQPYCDTLLTLPTHRVTVYVFAHPEWLVIVPKCHTPNVLMAKYYSINNGIAYLSGALSDCLHVMPEDDKLNYFVSSLPYLDNQATMLKLGGGYTGNDYTDPLGYQDYRMLIKSFYSNSYVDPSSLVGDNLADYLADYLNKAGAAAAYTANNLSENFEGVPMFTGKLDFIEEPGTCCPVKLITGRFNGSRSYFYPGEPHQYSRPVYGLKTLTVSDSLNYMDKFIINCDEDFHIDDNGSPVEHCIINVNTINSLGLINYAIPT